jgi:hypothetical protein
VSGRLHEGVASLSAAARFGRSSKLNLWFHCQGGLSTQKTLIPLAQELPDIFLILDLRERDTGAQ